MKISAKAEYACLAVLELALRASTGEPVRASEIAESNDIPQRFLVQILLQLKGAGYVVSTRGASGGYRLAVEPDQLNVWEIIQTIDGPLSKTVAEQTNGKSVGWQVLSEVWSTVNREEQQILENTHFNKLLQDAQSSGENMYYI